LTDWLPGDHLAWFVLDAVEQIDLSPFYKKYRTDGVGNTAFHPSMMVALLMSLLHNATDKSWFKISNFPQTVVGNGNR